LALTNCLNFGNPEKPEIMWEFAEATRGMAAAAEALGTPVVSGNVSFYNETSGRAIFPTPTIGMVGLLEDWERHAVSHFPAADLGIVLLGENREDLGGSEWLALRRGIEAGFPPAVDLQHERRLIDLLVAAVADGAIRSAHDIADGGLAVALAECTFTGDAIVGANVSLSEGFRPDALLFGESTGRVIAATEDPEALLALARAKGVPAHSIGTTGGDRLRIGPPTGDAWIDTPVAQLRALWEAGIPRRLEVS
jgi:phosphoribosylformylglycinamidine synthase